MRWIGGLFLVFSVGCSAITSDIQKRYGQQAAATATRSIAKVVAAGPTGAAAVGVAGGKLEGDLAVGYYASALGARRPELASNDRSADLASIADSDLALVLGAEFGWLFRREAGFGAVHVGAGWSLISGGMRVTGAFDGDEFGFAIGPEIIGHLRLEHVGNNESELQAYLRADFFVGNHRRYPHQYLAGVRFLFDLY